MKDQLMTLEEALRSHQVMINFTKINGEARTMLCTKDFSSIPTDHQPKIHDPKNDTSLLKVYDLEKKGWRSMKIDNITSWELNSKLQSIDV